jgi:hypothetical protein
MLAGVAKPAAAAALCFDQQQHFNCAIQLPRRY